MSEPSSQCVKKISDVQRTKDDSVMESVDGEESAKKQRMQALTLFFFQQVKNVAEKILNKHTTYSQQGIIPNFAT